MTQPSEPPPQNNESKAPDSPSAERQFVQKSVQALIQWSPLGLSGFQFVHFLVQQDWVLTIVTFPVLIVTTIWAAYTESFLNRLREVFSDRGKQDVDSLMGLVSKLNQAIRWQLAETEGKYLKCQANACRAYNTEGFSPTGIFTPMQEEVYVPLELSADTRMPVGFSRAEVEAMMWQQQQKELLIWDFLSQVRRTPVYRNLVILAWGGYGKTTLLRHIAYLYAYRPRIVRHRHKAPKLIPVLLYLRKWHKVIANQTPSLPDLITNHHLPELPEGNCLKLPPNWAENLLRDGKALVMFDGFDEVAEGQRQTVSQWIQKQMTQYPRSVFVLTSRPKAYQEDYIERSQAQLFVKRFNEDQQKLFVERWYRCQERYASGNRNTPEVKAEADRKAAELIEQIRQRPELAGIADNPLLLNMIATFHRLAPTSQLPQRRAELYREICRLQLGDRPTAKSIDMPLEPHESQQILQHVALAMVQQNQTTIALEPLLGLMQSQLMRLDDTVSSQEFLKKIVDVSELLVKRDDEFEFSHLSFQGYLAAAQIKQLSREDLLLQNHDKSWWRETILLYTAQVKNPSNLIRGLVNVGASDLAYACLKESPRKIDPVLEAELSSVSVQVQNSRYRDLERFLQNQQWREADEETYRLMITTVGKEEGQWFDREDLLNFPCEDLRTIDQLWVRHSNGKYGFSVQKKIWQECSSPKEYNNDWKKFGDRIEWRMNGDWVTYEVIFDRMGAEGHLPVAVWGWLDWGGDGMGIYEMWIRKLGSLFSRRDL